MPATAGALAITEDPTMERPAKLGTKLRRIWRYARIPLIALALPATACVSAVLFAVYAFSYPADTLAPDRGGPLVIVDRHGQVLRSVPSADGRPGRQNWVSLDQVPSAVLLTVIASEDERFYRHRGVDGLGIARATWLNLKGGRVSYGGSTITMQLARMLHSAGQARTLKNKVKEAVLAMRMERAVDKKTILETYLNRAYYGNGAYGIEAAARLYFNKPAIGLSLAEATLLAVIPRAPGAYDPIKHLSATVRRRDYIIDMLIQRDLISDDIARHIRTQPVSPTLHPPPFFAGHFTDWVLTTLPPEVRARGGVVHTTLDLNLQLLLERRALEHVEGLRARNMQQAGVVVLDTQTGEVLAMVGSADYHGPDGQINIVTRRRHPGSALKPFVYALAIERGDDPASIAFDIHSDEPDFRVVNQTQPERGPVRYREALAGSYNMAAVDVLRRVGVARLMSLLREAGVGELSGSPDEYGLRLALGSAKVRLLDLASGYRFLVAGGRVRPATGIRRVESDGGRVFRPPVVTERRILSPETSFMVADMLADPEARRPAFGQELPFDLPFRVAAKTGTARGFADTVAIAVTNEFTVAAWGGNFDGTPTQGLVAMESAAPLTRAGLLIAGGGAHLTLPAAPDGVVERQVCPLSGKAPSKHCPHRKLEYRASGQQPTSPSASDEVCDWHRHDGDSVIIDYPDEAAEWAHRRRTRGGKHL